MNKITMAAVIAISAMAPTLSVAESDEVYRPGNTPYVGIAAGIANFDCKNKNFIQRGRYVPVDDMGVAEAPDEDGGNITVYDATLAISGNCRRETAQQYYGGVDFHIDIKGAPVLLGVEIGFIDFGHSPQQNSIVPVRARDDSFELSRPFVRSFEHHADTIYYGARLGYRVFDNRLLLYLKAGLHKWEYQREPVLQRVIQRTLDDSGSPTGEAVIRAPLSARSSVFDSVDIFYGAGVQYDIPYEKGIIGLRAEWQRFEIDSNQIDLSIDLFSLGVSYNFKI